MQAITPPVVPYDYKRQQGLSPIRKDGTTYSKATDEQAFAAQEWVHRILHRHGVEAVQDTGLYTGGDRYDIYCYGLRLGVQWMGFQRGATDDEPRLFGSVSFMVNEYDPQRFADLYVAVLGSTVHGFTVGRWAWHDDVMRSPTMRRKPCGVTRVLPVCQGHPFSDLVKVLRDRQAETQIELWW